MCVEISEEERNYWIAKKEAVDIEKKYWRNMILRMERFEYDDENEYWAIRRRFLEDGDNRAI